MKILITGGAGFIGSHISKQLVDAGHQVVVFDNLSKGHQDLVDSRARFIKGEISDEENLVQALEGVDSVIHLASLIEIPLSVSDPVGFAENNIMGSIHLFQAMKKAQVKKIVFSSTAVVYGEPQKLPLTEDHPLSATNPYGASKIAVEAMLDSYHHLENFDVTILRYFNPYGPGEKHSPETHAIPNFISSALKGEPLPVFWAGEQTRDFIYVEDLAEAHIKALDLVGFNVFNVGSDHGVKIKEVVDILGKIMGKNLEVKNLGERPGDVEANYASSAKLKEVTNWQAKYSLEEGLRKTLEWFKSQQK